MNKQDYGTTRAGEKTYLYEIQNQAGMKVSVADLGASLHSLVVPDKDGKLRDVVLGYRSAEAQEGAGCKTIGVIVGRSANRISGAAFTLNGVRYELADNGNGCNLHSGPDFFWGRVWQMTDWSEDSVSFVLHSPDGDQGYPGEIDIKVTYHVTDDNALEISYSGVPSKDTIINLTNHGFYNLNGHESGDVLTHKVWIDADAYTAAEASGVPTGQIVSVEGTPVDFRVEKEVQRDKGIDDPAFIIGHEYDHNFALNNGGKFGKVATLRSEESGILMEVFTDMPGMQLYGGQYIPEVPGKEGVTYHPYQGICFETQFFPDAINHENFPSPVCKAGEEFSSKTVYKFSV